MTISADAICLAGEDRQASESANSSGEKIGLAADVFLECDDIDTIEEQAASDDWGVSYTQLECGRFRGRYAAWACPEFALTHESYGRRVTIAGTAPFGGPTLIIPSRNSGPIHFKGEVLPLGAFAVLGSGEEIEFTTLAEVEFSGLQIRQSVFDRTLGELCDGEDVEVLDNPRVPSDPSIVFGDLGQLLPTFLPNEGLLPGWHDSEVPRRLFGSTLTERVVPAIADCLDRRPFRQADSLKRSAVAVRRAKDFLEANLDRDVSRAELCAASGAKLRSLHYGFERCYGVSPIAYHRFRRFKRAHEQLMECHPSERTVTDIATGSGFWHFGRFSADYKAIYGEPPSTTLANRRSA